MALIDKLNAIGDAIRAKTGKSDKLTLDQMPNEIAGIITNEDLNDILTEQEELIAQLQTELLGKTAGRDDTKIINALIDRSIVEISSDIAEIGAYAFTNCAQLQKIDFPNARRINGYSLQYCSALQNVNLPLAQAIGGYGFMGCTSLSTLDIPSVLSLSNYAFRKCSALTKIDLYQTHTIGTFAFYECTNLEAIILRKTDKICSLSAANAFQYTKIADGEGYIYVPSSLIDTYKAATNWSTYADKFRAIEDYPEICGGGN